ncbi:hypothetical protein GE21DRAFT_1270613 [Neurospora crassa]|nr:hypothetical protein GE21DRAFT_1270613 [Neurospora crassa]
MTFPIPETGGHDNMEAGTGNLDAPGPVRPCAPLLWAVGSGCPPVRGRAGAPAELAAASDDAPVPDLMAFSMFPGLAHSHFGPGVVDQPPPPSIGDDVSLAVPLAPAYPRGLKGTATLQGNTNFSQKINHRKDERGSFRKGSIQDRSLAPRARRKAHHHDP